MALPEIVLPAWAGKIGGKLPGRPPRFALVFALNTMLKRGLLPADMSLFDGRTFEIDVLDAGIKVRFTANAEKFIELGASRLGTSRIVKIVKNQSVEEGTY